MPCGEPSRLSKLQRPAADVSLTYCRLGAAHNATAPRRSQRAYRVHSMSIPVICPTCGAKFRVKDEFSGKQGRCPQCQDIFTVPLAVALVRDAPPSPSSHGRSPTTSSDPGTTARPTWPVPVPPPVPKPPPVPEGAPASRVLGQSPGPSALTPVAPAEADDRIARYAARRKRGLELPVWAWFALGALALAGMVFAAWWQNRQVLAKQTRTPIADDERRLAPDHATAVAGQRAGEARRPNKAPLRPNNTPSPPPARPNPGASAADVVAYVERGVVQIDGYEWNMRTSLGSGFVVDKARRLVVTNYHVISQATKADVAFSDGTRYGVEGYRAVEPRCDLAILQLNGLPENAVELKLQTALPRKGEDVIAQGNPLGAKFVVTFGHVSTVASLEDLSPDSQAFLRHQGTDLPTNRWIGHDARLSPGNSGGPLFNSSGDVIGVNTWVNTEQELGYAIQADQVARLLNTLFPTVHPLKDWYRPERTELSIQAQPGFLKRQYELCTQRDWTRALAPDFEALANLARDLTMVRFVISRPALAARIPADVRAILEAESAEVHSLLGRFDWRDAEHIQPINRFVASQPPEAESDELTGIFFFADVAGNVEQDERKAYVVTVAGHGEKYCLVEYEGEPLSLVPGSRCLVLGVVRGEQVNVALPDKPPFTAQVVLSNILLPLKP